MGRYGEIREGGEGVRWKGYESGGMEGEEDRKGFTKWYLNLHCLPSPHFSNNPFFLIASLLEGETKRGERGEEV